MTLSDLASNTTATIVDISALPKSQRKRLSVMGILPNTPITVVRRAPLGDPLQITARGVNLAIRKQMAALIEVEI